MGIKETKLFSLPKIFDIRGNLSFVEESIHIPFKIKRCYWIYDVPGGEDRGGHAYAENEEFFIALSGSFDININDGNIDKTYPLNRSYNGLYVPNGLWRQLSNFSTNSLALVLSSTYYDKQDYIRNYSEFKRLRNNNNVINSNVEERQTFSNISVFQIQKTSVFDCTLLELSKHHSVRKGNITVIESLITIPFNIKRVYYLYDIPGGESRGAHAHKELYQLVFAASGSFDIILDDGKSKRTFTLNRPNIGLLIVPGIWRELINFSSGSVCLVLASENYNENDYIRNYKKFIDIKNDY